MAKEFNDIFKSLNSVMTLLKDERFQHLLENYERRKEVFLRAYEQQDEVSSSVFFEAGGKHDLKPEDYLVAFSDFIKNKQKEIEAIKILLNKPKSWNTKALNELKAKLEENDFEEPKLRKAHKIVYHKDLVDIISMVKHAVKKEEPLLSIEERVEGAIKKVLRGKKLTYEQHEWMKYIEEHLKENLTIDKDDFDNLPVFEQRGGFNKFKKLFKENYKEIILEINEAIAA